MDGIPGGKLRYHRAGCSAHLDDASLDADADADADLVEMDGCYIPNNPAQYGLVELSPGHLQSYPGSSRYHPQPLGSAGQPSTGGKGYSGYGLGCNGLSGSGNNLNAAASGGGNSGNGGVYWSTDDMGSFSLPGLDLDPLPSLFPFSPCSSNNYNPPREFVSSSCKEKQPHDMADVLLSLKHAIVHPGQTGPLSPVFPGGYGSASASGASTASGGQPSYQVPSASLSYTVHPHQLMSPGGGYSSSQYCGGGQDQYGGGGGGGGGQPMHHNMFPSMSVNVSMNMTMHGYPPNVADNIQHQMTCPQMQWAAAPPNLSPVYPPPQGMMSPSSYPNGATYSFTADFRPPPPLTELPMSPPLVSYKQKLSPLYQASASPLRASKRTPKPPPVVVADEASRPNLCRICGKTYARPSTLKTHLRTHSGEKPYRCCDCNKTFSQAANLTAHVRTHSGEKPFRCPICDRRFSQSSSVTTHMRTHSGERPYRCRMCKKAFSDSSTLTKHLRIHSGEKPYQCKLCLLRFSQSGNLNRHMRVHGGSGNGTP